MLNFTAAQTLRTQLTQLPELLAWAHLALLPGSAPRGGRVTGATRTAPLPCRADVLSLLGPAATGAVHDEYGDQDGGVTVDGLLADWVRAIIAERQAANDWTGWVRLPGRLDEATATVAVRYLLFHHDWAVGRVFAGTYAAEIGQLHRTLNGMTGMPLAGRPVRMACPKCRGLTISERSDGMRQCCDPDCAAVLSRDEHAERAEQVLAELAVA